MPPKTRPPTRPASRPPVLPLAGKAVSALTGEAQATELSEEVYSTNRRYADALKKTTGVGDFPIYTADAIKTNGDKAIHDKLVDAVNLERKGEHQRASALFNGVQDTISGQGFQDSYSKIEGFRSEGLDKLKAGFAARVGAGDRSTVDVNRTKWLDLKGPGQTGSVSFKSGMALVPTIPPLAYRVLLYSDADVVRAPVLELLAKMPNLTLIGESKSRIDAVSKARGLRADLVLMDIGADNAIATLQRMQQVLPDMPVILIGTLTFNNVKASMEALLHGAVEFIPTPTSHASSTDLNAFSAELERILSELASRPRAKKTAAPPPIFNAPRPIRLTSLGTKRPHILLIGSSTGGPKAVTELLTQLGNTYRLPILITQHMPTAFTAIFAANLQRRTGFDTREGVDDEIVLPGRVYVAPGGRHQLLRKDGNQIKIQLSDGPPVNFCKPAVDPMFESGVGAYDGHILAVVLTGMGQDGREGARKIVAAGGTVLAQDKESSVVWGMPGAVAEAGLAAEVLPLDEIAGRIRALS